MLYYLIISAVIMLVTASYLTIHLFKEWKGHYSSFFHYAEENFDEVMMAVTLTALSGILWPVAFICILALIFHTLMRNHYDS